LQTANQPQPVMVVLGDVPLPPEWLQISGQTLINGGVTNADGSVWGLTVVSAPSGATVDVTPTVTHALANNDYTFDVQVTNVTIQSLTVVSNSATQIDATNWAVVKPPTNDYVIVQATLNYTNDWIVTNAATAIQWTNGEAVPGNPLQRMVTKSNSVETTVTASLGSSSSSLNVWVIWADLTNKVSGTLDPHDNAQVLFNGNWPTPIYYNVSLHGGNNGVGGGNTLGPIDCLSNPNLNYCYTVGRMEAKAILQPSNIGSLLTTNWDMRRTWISIFWNNGTNSPFDITGGTIPPSPENDTANSAFKSLYPTYGDIFDLDFPGCPDTFGTNINHTAECYDNFYEYVTVNLGNGDQVCSSTNTYSYEAQIDGDAGRVDLNSLSTSLITIPTVPHYTQR
jgi:hypothetical protein